MMADKILVGVVSVFLVGVILLFSAVFSLNHQDNKSYNKIIDGSKSELKDDEVFITFVSGTEYSPSDPDGMTIATLRDYQNNFINTSCWLTILYPNQSIFFPESLMNQNFEYGTYYNQFTVGETIGNYDQHISCAVGERNYTNGKAFHVANLSSIVNQIVHVSELNIQESIQTVMNAMNCTPENEICQRLNNINSSTNNLVIQTNISGNITTIIDYLKDVNESVRKIFYQVSAPDCIVGSTWTFQAKVIDETYNNLPFLDCELATARFGVESVAYDGEAQKYIIIHNCTSPDGIVGWDFECQRMY